MQFYKLIISVQFFLLERLIAIILFIISDLELTSLFAFVVLSTTSFLYMPTRCQLYVVLQCTISHPMQLVQHAILYSLTRSVTIFLSPLLFYFVYVHAEIASFYSFRRTTMSAEFEFVAFRIFSFTKTRDVI